MPSSSAAKELPHIIAESFLPKKLSGDNPIYSEQELLEILRSGGKVSEEELSVVAYAQVSRNNLTIRPGSFKLEFGIGVLHSLPSYRDYPYFLPVVLSENGSAPLLPSAAFDESGQKIAYGKETRCQAYVDSLDPVSVYRVLRGYENLPITDAAKPEVLATFLEILQTRPAVTNPFILSSRVMEMIRKDYGQGDQQRGAEVFNDLVEMETGKERLGVADITANLVSSGMPVDWTEIIRLTRDGLVSLPPRISLYAGSLTPEQIQSASQARIAIEIPGPVFSQGLFLRGGSGKPISKTER